MRSRGYGHPPSAAQRLHFSSLHDLVADELFPDNLRLQCTSLIADLQQSRTRVAKSAKRMDRTVHSLELKLANGHTPVELQIKPLPQLQWMEPLDGTYSDFQARWTAEVTPMTHAFERKLAKKALELKKL